MIGNKVIYLMQNVMCRCSTCSLLLSWITLTIWRAIRPSLDHIISKNIFKYGQTMTHQPR